MADRRSLFDDKGALLRVALKGHQSSMWTALPCIVSKYNAAKMTCEAQPAIQARVRLPDDTYKWISLPMLLDCPVMFPGGGGFTLTFPVKPGDECLVIFASRCIDAWWQSGGIQVQADLRMHDLSDGFAIVGPRSQPHVLPGVSTTDVHLRSDDGTAHIGLDAAKNVVVVSPGTATVTAPTIVLNGNVTINGTLTTTGLITAPDLATTVGGLPSMATHVHVTVVGSPFTSNPPTTGS